MGTNPNYDPSVSDGWIERTPLNTWQKVLLGIVGSAAAAVALAPVAAAVGPEAAAACLANPSGCGSVVAGAAVGGADGLRRRPGQIGRELGIHSQSVARFGEQNPSVARQTAVLRIMLGVPHHSTA
ncbi:hypothetical protein ABZ468_54760 [Streptomyces sp. NPDC005708]|uniref:hypothetical protein n=1 Tax=unclassified Streptomyces TaxID=2593676 RepID=UPI0033D6439C